MSHAQTVQASYDQQAAAYHQLRSDSRQSIQAIDAQELLQMMQTPRLTLPAGSWLDVGCGNGHVLAKLAEDGFPPESLHGADFSQGMITQATAAYGHLAQFQVGDATALPYNDEQFDVVVSNMMLHWLNCPDEGLTPQPAWNEMFRVLRTHGLGGCSLVSSFGDAPFMLAYREVYAENPQWHHPTNRYRDDPLGSIPIQEAVGQARQAGFEIMNARTLWHTLWFEDWRTYAQTVQAYGYEVFTRPFLSGYQQHVWQQIVERFRDKLSDDSYQHDWYSTFIKVRKP